METEQRSSAHGPPHRIGLGGTTDRPMQALRQDIKPIDIDQTEERATFETSLGIVTNRIAIVYNLLKKGLNFFELFSPRSRFSIVANLTSIVDNHVFQIVVESRTLERPAT